MDDRAKYLNFIDMIDGGGAGRSGDTFQGGGLLSEIANANFKPYGFSDRLSEKMRRLERENEMLRRKNQTGRAVSRVVDEITKSRARVKEMERQRGLQQDQNDPRGRSQMPMPKQAINPIAKQPIYPVVPNVNNEAAVPQGSYVQSYEQPPLPQESFSPISEEFKTFIQIQRGIEEEMGLPPMSIPELLDVFKVYKERGAI